MKEIIVQIFFIVTEWSTFYECMFTWFEFEESHSSFEYEESHSSFEFEESHLSFEYEDRIHHLSTKNRIHHARHVNIFRYLWVRRIAFITRVTSTFLVILIHISQCTFLFSSSLFFDFFHFFFLHSFYFSFFFFTFFFVLIFISSFDQFSRWQHQRYAYFDSFKQHLSLMIFFLDQENEKNLENERQKNDQRFEFSCQVFSKWAQNCRIFRIYHCKKFSKVAISFFIVVLISDFSWTLQSQKF